MLEFCLPAGGLWCVPISGAVAALRDRGIIPDVITGISAGGWAGYWALVENYMNATKHFARDWQQHSFKNLMARFVPPMKVEPPFYLLKRARELGSHPKYVKRLGVKHFYVGYLQLPKIEFVYEDILSHQSEMRVYSSLWRSSSLPFLTHHAHHCLGGIDGGLKHVAFPSPCDSKERILFKYWPKIVPVPGVRLNDYTRVVQIKTRIANPMHANHKKLDHEFESGYEQGMKLVF